MSRISRRRFFVHSAHTTVGVSAGWAALNADEWFPCEASAAEPASQSPQAEKPLRVCLVSGCPGAHSDQSLAAFQDHLEKNCRMRCSRAFARTEKDLPGLENLETSDCMLLFARRLTLPAEQIEKVQKYCRAGKPIVALRSASHAFENWLALNNEVFDKEILGGDYSGHSAENVRPEVKFVEAAKDHPVLKGVEPFTATGSLYKNRNPAADVTILLTGTIPGDTEPVAWVRQRRGRVFYTSLGHEDDFREANFLRLLTNAIRWTADG